MTKMIGAAEFKAKCLAILDEVQASGESITITKRGKPVATVSAVAEKTAPVARFGMMKGSITILGDIVSPIDPDWEAKWESKWAERLRDDGPAR
ncbi:MULTISPECIES: type II toxin-antitoxin system Phd/YefM family antitoxin [unclassified Sphingomonas]|uniref:type II toxin-antitoxin system Phd/YefM family antitoxin n=1 Tax=unclassified Sphingomonas TaxID=196159 RepID=UPI00026CCFAD|nr:MULTISPECIES: type II toxin-antitoxin system prevent-host-death family antitoxin [unclassified Sphingomonas]MDY7523497.1 type II toxin-antitoxin system prevent-host-death family antitoxin [Sphingomonas sp. 10B4]MEB0284448.1 type II toxin-antitoxin system prevent-host-death family antitoxin [Sphingomonas sp. 10B4]